MLVAHLPSESSMFGPVDLPTKLPCRGESKTAAVLPHLVVSIDIQVIPNLNLQWRARSLSEGPTLPVTRKCPASREPHYQHESEPHDPRRLRRQDSDPSATGSRPPS
jgi:hypothetical protein